MVSTFVSCFTPFVPSCTDKLTLELFSYLATDMQRLQESLEQNPPTLEWCSEAMLVVKKTHSRFRLYFERTLGSWEGVTMVEEYMNASLDLLDLCNLLKSSITRLDRHRMMVDFMVKTVQDASVTTTVSKMALERNEIEKNNPFMLSECHKMKSRNKMNILQPISDTMSILSFFIFCSTLHRVPMKIHDGYYKRFRNVDLFSEPIRKLALTFGEKLKQVQGTGRSILHENEMIEDALAACTAEFVSAKKAEGDRKLAERVKTLENSTRALKQGIDLFEAIVNELFDDVIKGRNKVIELINTNPNNLYNS